MKPDHRASSTRNIIGIPAIHQAACRILRENGVDPEIHMHPESFFTEAFEGLENEVSLPRDVLDTTMKEILAHMATDERGQADCMEEVTGMLMGSVYHHNLRSLNSFPAPLEGGLFDHTRTVGQNVVDSLLALSRWSAQPNPRSVSDMQHLSVAVQRLPDGRKN